MTREVRRRRGESKEELVIWQAFGVLRVAENSRVCRLRYTLFTLFFHFYICKTFKILAAAVSVRTRIYRKYENHISIHY
jgi:hypothetical protein